MARKRDPLEKTYYPIVEKWLNSRFSCFKSATNKGLRSGRIDVIGLRDVGGDLSSATETIAIEVKRGKTPFANACGQTFCYSVYANRVYLADRRDSSFSQEEIFIASHLGIGLVKVKGRVCTEVLSSPFYNPMARMQLELLEALGFGKCQLCNSVVQLGHPEAGNRFSNMCRENVQKAIKTNRGLMFWNHEVAERKRTLGIRVSKDEGIAFERRFICPDCIRGVISKISRES